MDFVLQEWVLFSLLGLVTAGFLYLESLRSGNSVSFHAATRLINSGALLVDIREGKDFKTGHIANAINIPHTVIKDRANELDKHKTQTLILVDKLGQHASAAARILKAQGFNVVRLQGGMMEWQAQNLPIVKA